MTITCFMCLAFFQTSPSISATAADPELGIWEQIARLEVRLGDMVAETDSRFGVYHTDPVRGYYINRSGVVLMVPIRYQDNLNKAQLIPPKSETPVPLPGLNKSKKTVSSITIRRKLEEWRAELQKAEQQKDADFERLVNELKLHIPEMVAALGEMARGENLILIIEERLPPWFFSGLSVKNQPTRKVVTLTVGTEVISQIHADETDVPNDLLSGVKRTTVDRKLANIVP